MKFGGNMRKSCTTFVALVLIIGARVYAEANAPLKLLHTTPLPGFKGDLDHSAVDLKGNRLFVTAEVHQTVEVFNLRSGERIHSITGFEGAPHEILFRPDSNTLIVADGGSYDPATRKAGPGSCKLFDGKTYRIIDTIALPPGVDSAEYNPVTKEYYVESRGPDLAADTHMISIIDSVNFKHTGDFILPGRRSEAMAIDGAGKTMYVNLTDEVGIVDLPTQKLKVVTSLPCVGVNDDMTFDTKRKRIYITGDGATSVFAQRDADHYEHIVDVPTGYRAKTSLYVPELNRLYINVSGGDKADAQVALQIYQVQP